MDGVTNSAEVDTRAWRAGYRADIDGLRALAVGAIVLAHFGVPGLQGGFVGVDIFFVISGFLIGGMIRHDMEAGAFSLRTFWLRRLRRIGPALLALLAMVLLAGTLLLFPGELVGTSRSALAALAFAANMYFANHVGYFADTSAEPLLHLWSLGVEEQFYLLYPLLALAAVRVLRRPLPVVLLASALSATWSVLAGAEGFYWLPARAWELLAGVLLANTALPLSLWKHLARRSLREALGLAGAGAIGWSIARFPPGIAMPGWHAALPAGGAAMLILAGSLGGCTVGRRLATRLPVSLGRLSYSLYLWHWPVLIFLLQGLPAWQLSPTWQLAGIASALLLAWASWHRIEQPFRSSRMSDARLVATCACGAGLIALAAALILETGGLPARFGPQPLLLARGSGERLELVLRKGRCFVEGDAGARIAPECLTTRPGQPVVLLLGDSNAAHLWPGLAGRFAGSSILQVTAADCRPVMDQPANAFADCRAVIDTAWHQIIPARRIDLLVLAGAWQVEDLPALESTLIRLRARRTRVLLVGPFASWELPVPRLRAIGATRGNPQFADNFLDPRLRALDLRMAAMTRRSGADYFAPLAFQCPQGRNCVYADAQQRPLVLDDNHLTFAGSAWIAARMSDAALRR